MTINKIPNFEQSIYPKKSPEESFLEYLSRTEKEKEKKLQVLVIGTMILSGILALTWIWIGLH